MLRGFYRGVGDGEVDAPLTCRGLDDDLDLQQLAVPRQLPDNPAVPLETPSSNLAAVVVLYRPSLRVVDNIATYREQVGRLYAIDNSPTPNSEVVRRLAAWPEVEYLALGRNEGIARALNVAAERARAAGFSWLFTMDQDSRPVGDMLQALWAFARALPPEHTTAIIAPYQRTHDRPPPPNPVTDIDTTMTSGNLLSLSAHEAVGGFCEAMFIDYVDHELCLRLRERGYRIVRLNNAVLEHRLGHGRTHRLLGRSIFVSHHEAARRYTITRNRLAVLRRFGSQFPEFRRFDLRQMAIELVGIVLYEDEKLSKLRNVWRGFRDHEAVRL